MDTSNLGKTLITWLSAAGIKSVVAIILLPIAFKIINTVARKIEKVNENNQKIDKHTMKTLTGFFKILAKIIVVLSLISFLGIDTTAMSALIASLGVAIGFALNGTLSNFAGGLLLVITRPFKVGDFVELCGHIGIIEEIRIVYTKIVTLDNRVVSIPNGAASTTNIVNFTAKELRRVDVSFQISQYTDHKKAIECINEVIKKEPLVNQEANNIVRVVSISEACLEISCWAWCKSRDYLTVKFNLNENVKEALTEAGIMLYQKHIDINMTTVE